MLRMFILILSLQGTGDNNNGDFKIVNNTLQTNAVLDFETEASLTIRVLTSDGNSGLHSQVLTIFVVNENDAPTGINLSSLTIAENQPINTTIGTLSSIDQDADSHTYSLVSGTGSTDNGSFTITGNALTTNLSFDFESKSTYNIRIQSDDGQGGTFQMELIITVTNINETPTAIILSSENVNENQPTGTIVGNLTTSDPDASDTYTYSLISGTGSTDNGNFTIVNNTLRTNAVFDFETDNSYNIRLQSRDAGGETVQQAFVITINNNNEAPTAINLTNTSFDENRPTPITIGTLSSDDTDPGDSHMYRLVSGTGSTDNGNFFINGNILSINLIGTANFENKSSYTIRVESRDEQSNTFEQNFTITVNDLNEIPTAITLSNNRVDENQLSGTLVGTLSATDPDAGESHTYRFVAVNNGLPEDSLQFTLSGNTITTNAVFNHGTKISYLVKIEVEDNGGSTFEQTFTIFINNLNFAPTDITLSNASVDENRPPRQNIGNFTSTDFDNHSQLTYTYSFVSGTSDDDNASFFISQRTLLTDAV